MKRSVVICYCFIVLQLILLTFYEHIYSFKTDFSETWMDSASLYSIGMKYRTDKIYNHHYERLYEKYLTKYRNSSVRLLEIGLGCGMPLGIGASALTWREYFGEKADIHFIEFKEQCAENWKISTQNQANITLHCGDQENVQFLEEFKSKMDLFDIIIDDGGHTMKQQQTSLLTLLPLVYSKGIYVIEDLETSYSSEYENSTTTISLIKTLVDELQLQSSTETNPILNRIFSFEISRGICFFTLK